MYPGATASAARDDLITDCDSWAYSRERDAALAKLTHGVVAAPAHSKSEYKRRVAQGDPSVLPPAGGVDLRDGAKNG